MRLNVLLPHKSKTITDTRSFDIKSNCFSHTIGSLIPWLFICVKCFFSLICRHQPLAQSRYEHISPHECHGWLTYKSYKVSVRFIISHSWEYVSHSWEFPPHFRRLAPLQPCLYHMTQPSSLKATDGHGS